MRVLSIHQFLPTTFFDDLAPRQNINPVTRLDRAQPMGYQNNHILSSQIMNRLHNRSLDCVIQCASGFVKQ